MNGGEDKQRHWLQSTVSLWQLTVAVVSLLLVFLTFILSNESRITRLEVRSVYGSTRNDNQDAEIEKLRAIASANQIAIGQLNAKLDIILQRQDAVLRVLGDTATRNVR